MLVPDRDKKPDAPVEQFRVVSERDEGAPDQCTTFPAGGSDGEWRTALVTAVESGFVHLAHCR